MPIWFANSEDRGIAKFCDRKILSYKLRIAGSRGTLLYWWLPFLSFLYCLFFFCPLFFYSSFNSLFNF